MCNWRIGLVTTICFVVLNKVRGFSDEVPIPPMVLLGVLSIIAFVAAC